MDLDPEHYPRGIALLHDDAWTRLRAQTPEPERLPSSLDESLESHCVTLEQVANDRSAVAIAPHEIQEWCADEGCTVTVEAIHQFANVSGPPFVNAVLVHLLRSGEQELRVALSGPANAVARRIEYLGPLVKIRTGDAEWRLEVGASERSGTTYAEFRVTDTRRGSQPVQP